MSIAPPKPWQTTAGATTTGATSIEPIPEWERTSVTQRQTQSTLNPTQQQQQQQQQQLNTTTTNIDNTTLSTTSPYSSGAYGAGGYGSSMYGTTGGYGSSMYGGGYGSSMYGGGYGSSMYGGGYGSSMYGGGYGSGMYGGGYGGYGMGGMMGGMMGPNGMPPNAAPSVIDSLQILAQAFARTAAVLDQNLFAFRGSYMSLHELYHLLSPMVAARPFGWITSFFKFLGKNIALIFGLAGLRGTIKSNSGREKLEKKLSISSSQHVKEFQNFSPNQEYSFRWKLFLVVSAFAMFGIPFLMQYFKNQMKKKAFESIYENSQSENSFDSIYGNNHRQSNNNSIKIPAGTRVRAIHDYQEQNPSDLGFKTGDVMILQSNDNTDSWWEAVHEETKRRGLIPSNFVEIVSGPSIARK